MGTDKQICTRCGLEIDINSHVFRIMKDTTGIGNEVEEPVCRKCFIKYLDKKIEDESKAAPPQERSEV